MNLIFKFIALFSFFFMLSSCSSNYIALRDAEMGMFMERANTESIQTFFNRRIENGLKSNINNSWQIFNEDADYVYFGKIKNKNGINFIIPFYKVNKAKLSTIFPGYSSIEGKHIKANVFQKLVNPIIEEKLITLCPQSYNIDYSKRNYKLTKRGIETDIKFTAKCYEDKMFKATIHATLDPSNLEITEENIIIK